ncbi:MAG: class I SAM-dependent RNA methyltransferase [Pseudomonadota bacterium]
MSEAETISRLAAKGDGVTQSGRHVKGAVPGDVVSEDGTIAAGPHRIEPSCNHFGTCGGCQLQHADEETLRAFVTDRVVNAARGQGIEPDRLLDTHLSPPTSRRRATLHAARLQNRIALGFREAGSHRIVDLVQCPILAPKLAQYLSPLRDLVCTLGGKGAVDVGLSLCDQGLDLNLGHIELDGLVATEKLLDFARDTKAARVSMDQGFGPDIVWEPEPVTITLSGMPVLMPVGAFLQATRDAEKRMVADARAWLKGSSPVVDLFAGLGTFAMALREGRKVLAVEADRAAHLACKAAAARAPGQIFTLHRDLFRNPLQPSELERFAAAVLDPPRAGAKAQIAQIAASDLSRVVYVSCNPSSWSRDAATLVEAGFKLEELRPVGQFRWSTHVELVSLFTRSS